MKLGNLARAALAAAATAVLASAGCSKDEPATAPTFCGQSNAAVERCAEKATSCDAVLTEGCAALDGIVSQATLDAARDCLESGVCGAASCLSRGQKNVTPSAAHKQLATNFCRFCAPDVDDCEAQFYARSGRLPGRLVLPYADKIVKAVDDACTGQEDCRAQFNTCARDAIDSAVRRELEDDLTDCVVEGFSADDGEQRGPGGGPQVAKCTPANCQGCCRDDVCEEGTSKEACGSGADACQTCTGTQQCTLGRCKDPCGPDNCPGCCDGDTCLLGTAPDKCGGQGAACQACSGSFVCSNHTCIDASCQATCTNGCCTAAGCQPGTSPTACGTGGEACVDCGPGRTCTLGACQLDPNSRWDFYISFAVVPQMDGTSAWDPLGGAPDPYLEAYSSMTGSSHSGYTTTKFDTTVPLWQETPLTNITAAELLSSFRIEIWDEDPDFDDFMGGCKIPLTPAIFDGSLQNYTCPAGTSGGEVEIYYRINPHP